MLIFTEPVEPIGTVAKNEVPEGNPPLTAFPLFPRQSKTNDSPATIVVPFKPAGSSPKKIVPFVWFLARRITGSFDKIPIS